MTKNKVNYELAVSLCDTIVKNSNGFFEKHNVSSKKYFEENCGISYHLDIKKPFKYKINDNTTFVYPKTRKDCLFLFFRLNGGTSGWAKGDNLLNLSNAIEKIKEKNLPWIEEEFNSNKILKKALNETNEYIDIKDFVNKVKEYQDTVLKPTFKNIYKLLNILNIFYKQGIISEKQEDTQEDIEHQRKNNKLWEEAITLKKDYER